MNTQLPVAPVIAGFREHYFVTQDCGKNVNIYSQLPAQHPEDDSLQDMLSHIFICLARHWVACMIMV